MDLRDKRFTLPGVLSPSECAQWIEFAEGLGFAAAPISTPFGFQMLQEVRNNTRVMFDDPARAEALWLRLSDEVSRRGPIVLRSWEYRAIGLNERLRIYRYRPEQFFDWHQDASFVREGQERSLQTAMVYLNGDFEGGTTDFAEGGTVFSVAPESGLALLFDHPLEHRGARVTRGTKYVLRTDVMYRRVAVREGA